MLGGGQIYGFDGIVIAQVFYCFPHAMLILVTALATADARLYEAADALGASKLRVFFTVTLPGAKYGLISAALVVFTLVITDFGVAKVIGGNFNVLATDVYKQVIGQQNFSMGAVVGMVLLAPAALAFVVDRLRAEEAGGAADGARRAAGAASPSSAATSSSPLFCTVVSVGILGHPRHGGVGLADQVLAVQSQPDAGPTTSSRTSTPTAGTRYFNSLRMAAGAAIFGTALMFVGAWLTEKTKGFGAVRGLVQLARLPADGGARPGARAGLHLLLQRAATIRSTSSTPPWRSW